VASQRGREQVRRTRCDLIRSQRLSLHNSDQTHVSLTSSDSTAFKSFATTGSATFFSSRSNLPIAATTSFVSSVLAGTDAEDSETGTALLVAWESVLGTNVLSSEGVAGVTVVAGGTRAGVLEAFAASSSDDAEDEVPEED
jgi:hypothetical protein